MAEVKEKNVPITKQVEEQPSGVVSRHTYSPSLFSLLPRDFFTLNPFQMMARFSEEMDKYFFGALKRAAWSPAVEVFERDNKYFVRTELPGLDKDNIKVEISDNTLIIKGERKFEHEEKKEGFYRSERSYGSFYRSVPLPENSALDQAQATFNNGVLEFSVPIPESRRQEVPIQDKAAEQAQAAKTT
ncbi:MAG: Hsp20/alpha crystallin family protein [Acidobacteriota bacterium]